MATLDWSGWSEWYSLPVQQGFSFVNAPRKPGAYVIAAEHPINRAVGTDEHGILTVGESEDLHRRVLAFATCAISRGGEDHIAGWRYALLRFARHFPFSSLRIRWKTTNSKRDANALEGAMLLAYLSQHLELPPLNYKFNWSQFEKEGWDLFDVMIGLKQPSPPLDLGRAEGL